MGSRFPLLLLLPVLAGAVVGCGGSSTKQGGERQDCYPNGTCNAGLVCLSNVCVSSGGTGGTGGGGTGGTGGGGTGGTGGGMCQTVANHGDLGSLTAPPAVGMSGMIDWPLPLEPGTPRDEFDIQIYDSIGVFQNGVAPGTYALTGDELNFSTCGLCVLIYENIAADTSYRGAYLATAGTVILTSVTGTLAGTAANLKFQHVNIDPGTLVSTPDPDGCRSAVDSVAFDVPINAN